MYCWNSSIFTNFFFWGGGGWAQCLLEFWELWTLKESVPICIPNFIASTSEKNIMHWILCSDEWCYSVITRCRQRVCLFLFLYFVQVWVSFLFVLVLLQLCTIFQDLQNYHLIGRRCTQQQGTTKYSTHLYTDCFVEYSPWLDKSLSWDRWGKFPLPSRRSIKLATGNPN